MKAAPTIDVAFFFYEHFAILSPMKEHENKKAPHEEPEIEVDFEPEEELGTVGAVKAKMQKLKDELEKTKAERQEYLDGWQRCKADSINSRKELVQQAERSGTRARDALVEQLIPALDSFDMAAGSEQWATIDDGFRTGMEHVRGLILEALMSAGVERFGKVGELFNPYLHEAIEERDDVAGKSGTIARILRYGYKSGDKIIRPAQVIIKR